MVDNKRIVKNTLFLYIRMLIILGVTLYTSRVVLNVLGIVDYGLYNVVGGIVGMLSFLCGTLSIGTARFLTYELGTNNKNRLHQTFNTAFYTHLVFGGIIFIVMETIGLWFVYNKVIIPPERLDATFVVYQISILTTIIALTQVPYTSVIMAHEEMKIYAYVCIFEAIAKLSIVYFLSISTSDRLVFYAFLILGVQILIAAIYRIYCVRHFEETKLKLYFNKSILKEFLNFSSWNVIASISETLKLQGIILLFGIFFQPVIVAAQAIANQVGTGLMQFINSFRSAINPQIIKLFASNNYEDSKKLTLQSTVYVFELLLLLGIPIFLLMKPILHIWLVDVPPYTIIFSQLVVLQKIIGNFDAAFYIPMMASGKIKSNSVASVYLGIGQFAVLYIILKIGYDVMWVQYISLGCIFVMSFFIKPYILYKDLGYRLTDFLDCYLTCFKAFSFSILLPLVFSIYLSVETVLGFMCVLFSSIFSVIITSYMLLGKTVKNRFMDIIKQKLSIK